MAVSKRVKQEPQLLDLYAAFALMGLLARNNDYMPTDAYAVDAFEFAEAMLQRREKILNRGAKDE